MSPEGAKRPNHPTDVLHIRRDEPMTADAPADLRAWMAAHERETIDLLRRIVNMDTATPNREGVEALAGAA